jgi:uncharacterized surface protein with fasciclin (FAS1) repeats
MKKSSFSMSFVIILLVVSSCSGRGTSNPSSEETSIRTHGQAGVVDKDSRQNILQIASASNDHTTLAAACNAAGMLDVLANAGPLTVFAPTNAAFEKLPAGEVDNLLKPENKETLAKIIQFHAAPGNFKIISLKDNMKLYMASGHYVDVKVKEDGVFVNGSKIVATIDASNGTIHVVKDVFLPPAEDKDK